MLQLEAAFAAEKVREMREVSTLGEGRTQEGRRKGLLGRKEEMKMQLSKEKMSA